jgi:hypothetical protein
MSSALVSSLPSRDAALVLVGGLLFAVGFLFGGLAGAAPAVAGPHGGGFGDDRASFGFAVPAQGFALVKGEDRGAYIINGRGEAMRVLVSVSPSAADQPQAGSTAQLPLD